MMRRCMWGCTERSGNEIQCAACDGVVGHGGDGLCSRLGQDKDAESIRKPKDHGEDVTYCTSDVAYGA